MIQAVAELFQTGGVWMWPILVVAIFGVAITLERLYQLLFAFNVNGEKFFSEVKRAVLADKVNDAIKLCDEAPLPSIVKAGLIASSRGADHAQRAMDEAALQAIPKIEKRTHYLSMVANVSTLLGLLGTIFGLIVAFKAVAIADPGEKANELARGISIAMSTTAFGLIVAIPIMMIFAYLQAKSTKLIDEIDEYSLKSLHLIQSLDASKRGQGE
ncbi:MAG: MotA/TolQ/ExbB proton channel family protein [Myxococcales bacterium]|nr:MotA/TolQ/ExbB proton channel family protein [Myxococcales bacterium]